MRKSKQAAKNLGDDSSPTPERARHGPIERLDHAIADEAGRPARPYRGLDTLTLMPRRGTISPGMHQAAKDFRALFHCAGLDPLRVPDLPRRVIDTHARVQDRRQAPIAGPLVGRENADRRRDGFRDEAADCVTARIIDDARNDCLFGTADRTHDNRLIVRAARWATAAFALFFMPIAAFAADERLVHFGDAHEAPPKPPLAMAPEFVAICVAMRATIVIAVLLLLTGCGTLSMGQGPDIRVIQECAAKHPPPPQANVERLGLLPVYFTGTAASNDDATRQWFADMNACVQETKPADQTK